MNAAWLILGGVWGLVFVVASLYIGLLDGLKKRYAAKNFGIFIVPTLAILSVKYLDINQVQIPTGMLLLGAWGIGLTMLASYLISIPPGSQRNRTLTQICCLAIPVLVIGSAAYVHSNGFSLPFVEGVEGLRGPQGEAGESTVGHIGPSGPAGATGSPGENGTIENLPADNIYIIDLSGYYLSDNVEEALQEIGASIDNIWDNVCADNIWAENVFIVDGGGYYISTNLEDALVEIIGKIDNAIIYSLPAENITVLDIGGHFDNMTVENVLAELWNIHYLDNANIWLAIDNLTTHVDNLRGVCTTYGIRLDNYQIHIDNLRSKVDGLYAENTLIWAALVDENMAETASRSIYVDNDTGDDGNGGASWGDAFQTLQCAVDDIKPIVANGVTVTVWARGQFEMNHGDYGVYISRVCAGSGNIVIRADDYITNGVIISSTNNTLNFSGTYATNYWQNCYVVIYYYADPHVGEGQIKKITASSSAGGITTITVDSNWSANPDTSNRFSIGGRAALTTGYGGLYIYGKTTVVSVYGLSIHDLASVDYGDGNGVLVANGAAVDVIACIGYNNGIYSEDFGGDFTTVGALLNVIQCGGNRRCDYSAAATGIISNSVFLSDWRAVIVRNFSSVIMNYCYVHGDDMGIRADGGVASGYIVHGTDGTYGCYAEGGGIIGLAFTDLSVAADSDTFGHAERYLGGGVTEVAPLVFENVGINNALHINEAGAGATMGVATLVAGEKVVNTTAVTANSVIFLSRQTASGSPLGHLHITARTAGVSFTITASGGGETSTIAWLIIEPT